MASTPSRTLTVKGPVGFDSLPNQLVNKAVGQGFAFNILCIGETGVGKSTLMDTLFSTEFDSTPNTHHQSDVRLKSDTYELQESNVKLKLTIVDTQGFGDQIDKSHSCDAIEQYIDAQFESYLQEELKIRRALFSHHDSRIHVCLYFITPTGHSLKSLDLVTMKKLDQKVNIIPIIAKSDTITKPDLLRFKEKIRSELEHHGVQIYHFPTDDETVSELNQQMNKRIPFAIVGGTDTVRVGNKQVRARQYPWGTVQVENEHHCDFVHLREMLVRTNMEDLRTRTHSLHYELYRRNRLTDMGLDDSSGVSVSETLANKRSEHESLMRKQEEDMRQSFVARVKDKEAELKEREKQLHVRFEAAKREHSEQRMRLDDERRALEQQIADFQRRKEQAAASTLKRKK